MYIDSHTHLLDKRFDEDREQILASLERENIECILECTADEGDFSGLVELIRCDRVYGAIGVHPHSASEVVLDTVNKISDTFESSEKILAIGEIGLDYHYDFSPRSSQKKAFYYQLALAQKLDAPVVIHSREATKDTLSLLFQFDVPGVMHCFSGSIETAKQLLDKGFYIGLGGSLTFNNANNLREVARYVPLERILIETDCPYMTPVPHRGQRNQPAFVKLVAQRLANIKGISADQVAHTTTQNTKTLFCIN